MEARLAEESRLCTYLPLSLKSFLGLFSPFSFATSHLTVLSFSGFIAELSLGNNCFSSRRATTAYDGEITFPSIEPTVFVTQVAKQHDVPDRVWSSDIFEHYLIGKQVSENLQVFQRIFPKWCSHGGGEPLNIL